MNLAKNLIISVKNISFFFNIINLCRLFVIALLIVQLILYYIFKLILFMCNTDSAAFNLLSGLLKIIFFEKLVIFKLVYLNFDFKHFFPLRSVYTFFVHFSTVRAKLILVRIYARGSVHTLMNVLNLAQKHYKICLFFSGYCLQR